MACLPSIGKQIWHNSELSEVPAHFGSKLPVSNGQHGLQIRPKGEQAFCSLFLADASCCYEGCQNCLGTASRVHSEDASSIQVATNYLGGYGLIALLALP